MPKGSMPRGSTKKLKTTMNPDGSQQYVRGKGGLSRVLNASKSTQTAAHAAERAFRKGNDAVSERMTKAEAMLDRAQLAEGKRLIASRRIAAVRRTKKK